MRHAMIMAGGVGTRLWPMSRAERPKQVIPFIPQGAPGGTPRTLLQVAADRLEGLVPQDRRYICTGERYRGIIRDSMPEFTDDRILGEPVGRDTVNAVGLTAAVLERADPEAVFAVLTADHVIRPQQTFARAMDIGFRLVEAEHKRLVSFGVTPTYPATGFGYIQRGGPIDGFDDEAFTLSRFVEKPPLERAERYLEAGGFYWNAGMFVFHAATFMELLGRYQPESFAGLTRIAESWAAPDRTKVLNDVYPTLPKISVDYAIMEPAAEDSGAELCGVRMDVEWLDVGSWPSFAETLEGDEAGNRPSGGPLITEDASGNLAVSDDPDHTIALVGCADLVVVHTGDATLVMPRQRAQDLKKLHAKLPGELR